MELLTQNEAARVASVKTAVSTFTVLTYHSPQIIWEKVPLKPYDHSAEWRGAQILTATFQGAMMALWGLFGDLGDWLLRQLKPFSCTQWLKKKRENREVRLCLWGAVCGRKYSQHHLSLLFQGECGAAGAGRPSAGDSTHKISNTRNLPLPQIFSRTNSHVGRRLASSVKFT